MSAFVVSDETMHRCVKAAAHSKLWPEGADRDELGRALFNMNYAAMSERYGDRNEPSQYVFEDREASPAEMWKALQCLIYQASEGDVPESAIYKLTQEASDRLARCARRNTNGRGGLACPLGPFLETGWNSRL